MNSKKFTKTERRGLPGGPNEMFTYVTGVFSTEGYKNGSPDIDNPFNIIPSGNITMKDVDFPVMGIDNLGNKKMMMPGGEYEFPGDMVFEIPMGKSGIEIKPENRGKFTRWAKKRGMTVKQAYAKVLANKDKYPPSIVKMANFARNAAGWKKEEGGQVSWKFKGKTYSGTLIPSMEDANNRYARTHNGKIKTLPKKKMGGKLRIYKDFVNGVYDNSSSLDFVKSVYDKVNRIYMNQAKEANMSTPNYVMSFLVDA